MKYKVGDRLNQGRLIPYQEYGTYCLMGEGDSDRQKITITECEQRVTPLKGKEYLAGPKLNL